MEEKVLIKFRNIVKEFDGTIVLFMKMNLLHCLDQVAVEKQRYFVF